MGLGGLPEVSLADARKARDAAERLAREGHDPIDARNAARKPDEGKPTFGETANALIGAKAPEWRSSKHRQQWRMTLETYAAPLWGLPVDEVAIEAILSTLQPLWQRVPETAQRLRARIEAVLDFAKASGLRSGENPARWRGHLALILPKRQRLARGHHAALPFDNVPAFIAALREREAMAALALEFLILTAARSGEALGATWQEIDFSSEVWIVPAARMKAGREHRVPLSGRAASILEKLSQARASEFIFRGQRHGKPLSPTSLEMTLRRMKIEGATIHGFRSSFRDWAGDRTEFQRETIEAALAHASGDATEQAYRRGDALQKRRALMKAWASFCEPRTDSNVVLMARK
jgi:integrase